MFGGILRCYEFISSVSGEFGCVSGLLFEFVGGVLVAVVVVEGEK